MRGRWVRLSRPRRLIVEYVQFAKSMPIVAIEKRMQLGPVVAARKACAERPSWIAVFLKAYAVAAQEFPELRRAYVKLPWPHFYEHPVSIGGFTVNRDFRGEPAVFQIPVTDPAALPLAELHRIVRHGQTAPIEEVKLIRQMLWFSLLPWPLRRAISWIGLNIGLARSHALGTFGVTTITSLGAWSLHTLSPMPAMVTFGVIEPDGGVTLRFFWDHRIMDGVVAAHALARLENVLVTQIADELRQQAQPVVERRANFG